MAKKPSKTQLDVLRAMKGGWRLYGSCGFNARVRLQNKTCDTRTVSVTTFCALYDLRAIETATNKTTPWYREDYRLSATGRKLLKDAS